MPKESWRDYPLDARYQVSTHGRVRNKAKGNIRVPVAIKSGYLTLLFSSPQKLRYIHVMVLETFVSLRPSPETDASHKNGDRTNNKLSNLVWESRTMNIRRKVRHGKEPLGERRWSAKITEEQARFVKYTTLPARVLAGATGVSISQVNRIRAGLNWPHI